MGGTSAAMVEKSVQLSPLLGLTDAREARAVLGHQYVLWKETIYLVSCLTNVKSP